jgi:hypothetical protein
MSPSGVPSDPVRVGRVARAEKPAPAALPIKAIVVGHTDLQFCESVSWSAAHEANLVDYHVIILDLSALNENLGKVTNLGLRAVASRLARRLSAAQPGGVVMLITPPFHSSIAMTPKEPKRVEFTTYSWLEGHVGFKVVGESGNTLHVDSLEPFGEYLGHLTSWDCYCETAKNLKPLVRNLEGKSVAVKCAPADASPLYLLPTINTLPAVERVRLVWRAFFPSSEGVVAAPHWLSGINVPGVSELGAKIERFSTEIDALKAQRDQTYAGLETLERWRGLLYLQGDPLDDLVQDCLRRLGLSCLPKRYADEDFVIEDQGKIFICEVKGTRGNITLKQHLRQLIDYLAYYEGDSDARPKGIFFGNANRELPLAERGKADTPDFPRTVIERATALGISLVSTRELFAAFCGYLEARLTAREIAEAIESASGPVNWRARQSSQPG